jgi:queuine tRNA-ribosyltransferase
MGVGDLQQMKEAVSKGIDMFDCVAPMREARHGNLWLADGKKLRMRRSEFIHDHAPLDSRSPTELGRTTKRSYLHHLLRVGERYGETIACTQNMAVTLEWMRNIRTRMR